MDELVRFDPDGASGTRIRVWDRVEGDLVERVVENDVTPCRALDLWWQVRDALGFPFALRLSEDEAGERLFLTAQEAAESELAVARAELERLRKER